MTTKDSHYNKMVKRFENKDCSIDIDQLDILKYDDLLTNDCVHHNTYDSNNDPTELGYRLIDHPSTIYFRQAFDEHYQIVTRYQFIEFIERRFEPGCKNCYWYVNIEDIDKYNLRIENEKLKMSVKELQERIKHCNDKASIIIKKVYVITLIIVAIILWIKYGQTY